MATVLYRCPNTGFRVQGYTEDEPIPSDRVNYEPITCLACKLVHLVNLKSGKLLGEEADEKQRLRRNSSASRFVERAAKLFNKGARRF
jgi:hypothetical protein